MRLTEGDGRLADGRELDRVTAGALDRATDAGRHPQRQVGRRSRWHRPRGRRCRRSRARSVPLHPHRSVMLAHDRPMRRPHGTPGATRLAIRVTSSRRFVVRSRAGQTAAPGAPRPVTRTAGGSGRRLARPEPEPLAGSASLGERRQALARDRRGRRAGPTPAARRRRAARARVAGQPVEVDAQPGGVERVEALGQERPDRAPARTSPVPPLARAGFSNGAMATWPSGVAMTVRAPLRTTTWRQVVAASRAAATRASSSSARSPSSRRLAAAPGPQSGELAGVRGQHGRPSLAVPPAVHRRDRPQRLGVEHDRRRVGSPGADDAADGRAPAVARPGRSPGPMTIASCS